MKVLSKEEEDAHYAYVIRGGLKGGAYGLGIGGAAALLLNHRWPFFRNLTLPFKTFFVTSSATFALIVAAENASHDFEVSRHMKSSTYQDQMAKFRAEQREQMSTTDKFMDWGRENRYKIVGASWVASMAGSLALVYRDKYLSKAQKLVQARVYAQGLTLLVLLASAAFEISDARRGDKDIIMVPDPSDPTGQRRIPKKIHHERYEGEDLWMDMVKGEEERMKRRKEEAERAKETAK
ncbi:hypothetical protein ABW19_dt0202917 [Dactylella cylindrospora]|nr:hypothetical protein ABW19_dt0202917 [Dactylella cylindrospora]